MFIELTTVSTENSTVIIKLEDIRIVRFVDFNGLYEIELANCYIIVINVENYNRLCDGMRSNYKLY